LERDREVDLATADEQASVTHPPVVEVVAQARLAVVGDGPLATVNRGHAQTVTGKGEVPPTSAPLQHDTVLFEGDRLARELFGGTKCSVFAGNVADAASGDLSREAEPFAYVPIRKPVQPDSVRQVAVLEGDHAHEV